ncbi:MAG: hypothetical protein A2Y22_00195 [Clostridiales bacterium GWD2_32_59]|nr:MAG: hypothetical protein A2Y22_00195 [Clostridiales bacterium GWD2_32_59]
MALKRSWKYICIIFILATTVFTTVNFFSTENGKNLFEFDFKSNVKTDEKLVLGNEFGIYENQPEINYIKYAKPVKVKGIFLSEWTLSSKAKRKYWIDIINSTELNTIVLNVKNDDGMISFDTNVPLAKEIGSIKDAPIKDMRKLIIELKENGIYPIARIVVFKDPYLANKRPDLAIKNKDGSILRMKSSSGRAEAWVNPYNKEIWDYVVNVAKDAADVGFEEIQFDYIRFSTGIGIEQADFGELAKEKTKQDIISEFTEYAVKQLKTKGVYVSADVYGTIINSTVDSKIVGQDYVEMSKHLDYICPMVYPSHFASGSMGVKYPDLQPYDIILKYMQASEAKLSAIKKGEHKAIVRPWLQDFTASWVKPYQKYTAKQIREQKKAVYDANLEEWILWDANNKYTLDGLDK